MIVHPGRARSPLVRTGGAIFLLLVAINAAVGVTALVVGEFGQTQGKVLGTSLLATAACIGVLINVPAIRAARIGPVPLAAAALAVLTAGLLTVGMWAEFDTVSFGKLASSSALLTVAGTYAGLMSLVGVRGGALRALLALAYALAGLGTLALLTFIWFEIDSPAAWRLVGVGAVLLAANTLALSFLGSHRERRELLVRRSLPAPALAWHCPRCGRDVEPVAIGERVVCSDCGTRFAVLDGEAAVSGADRAADEARPPSPPPDRPLRVPAAR